MSGSSPFLVVNTDLDATLLDHDSYSWEPAREAVQALKARGAPIVLNSSKTLAEMKDLAQELGLQDPLVCENGSVVAIPVDGGLSRALIEEVFGGVEEVEGYFLCHLGVQRSEFIGLLHELRASQEQFDFEGYADWSVTQVAEHTGLPIEKAVLSHERNGTEPIHWHGSEEGFECFQQEVARHHLKCVSGGRFIHVSGLSDKANGLLALNRLYQKVSAGQETLTIALGDSPNDLGMLNAADIAVVIPNHTELEVLAPRVIHAKEQGPRGWNTEILELLKVV